MTAVTADAVALRTDVPIALLVGAGVLACETRVLREGDARVLNAHVYWFALPARLVANISEMNLDRGNARFVLATMSFFMLGAFLYGRCYVNLGAAAGLALLRLVPLLSSIGSALTLNLWLLLLT